MSQRELARRMNIRPSTVSHLCSDKVNEEVPIYVCKVNDNTVNGYSDPFHVSTLSRIFS
ncbi:helix-turn-helix domain-containing protein [Paenibacillus kribbensis]|uniref:helix-turn-helix domain-containing protein n=1 Tax=Paenibacillus kribbensis TaxID=172713 RepID=UPI003CC62591